jgi:hypothetical protein
LGARGDRAEAQVVLVQELAAVRRGDRDVDLEQLAPADLVAVLAAGQLAELGIGPPGDQRRALLTFELEPPADEARLIGVDDVAVRCPDLHPDHRVVQDALPDQPVHPPPGSGIPRHEPVADLGLDDPHGQRTRELRRVVLGVGDARAVHEQRAGDGDDDEGDEAGQREGDDERRDASPGAAATADEEGSRQAHGRSGVGLN